MTETTLVADTGRRPGSRASNRLRAAGRVPGVLYGHGMEPVALSVDRKELRQALSGRAGVNAVVRLQVEGRTHPTVVKELQRHPVRHTVLHVDFQVVSMTEEITVDVPVVPTGEARQVLMNGGLVEQIVTTIPLVTTPASIPNEIPVDVTTLAVGDIVRVGDLQLPAGTSTALDDDTVVISAVLAAGVGGPAAGPEPEAEAEGVEAATE